MDKFTAKDNRTGVDSSGVAVKRTKTVLKSRTYFEGGYMKTVNEEVEVTDDEEVRAPAVSPLSRLLDIFVDRTCHPYSEEHGRGRAGTRPANGCRHASHLFKLGLLKTWGRFALFAMPTDRRPHDIIYSLLAFSGERVGGKNQGFIS